MRKAALALAALLALGFAPAAAQSPFGAELSVGASAGRYAPELTEAGGPLGPAVQALVSYRPAPLLGGYASVGYARFGCDGGFCAGTNMTFSSVPLGAGLELRYGAAWLRAGAERHALHASWSSPIGEPAEADAEPALGPALSVGAALGGGRYAVVPSVRYASFSATFPGEEPADVTVLSAAVGVRLSF